MGLSENESEPVEVLNEILRRLNDVIVPFQLRFTEDLNEDEFVV